MFTNSLKWRNKAKRCTSATWQDMNQFVTYFSKHKFARFHNWATKVQPKHFVKFYFQVPVIVYFFHVLQNQNISICVIACHVLLSTVSPDKIKDSVCKTRHEQS